MKKFSLTLVLSLLLFAAKAQEWTLGPKTAMLISNGVIDGPYSVDQFWTVETRPYYSLQFGLNLQWEHVEWFKPYAEVLFSKEGNNYLIYPNNQKEALANPSLWRKYVRLNLGVNFGGILRNHPKLRIMGGLGFSQGFLVKNQPTHYAEDTMDYYKPLHDLKFNSYNYSLLFSVSIGWHLGIGWLEFNPRFRQSLNSTFANRYLPEDYNRTFEFNISYVFPIGGRKK